MPASDGRSTNQDRPARDDAVSAVILCLSKTPGAHAHPALGTSLYDQISDRKGCRQSRTGLYAYARFMEGGRYRSRYIGKASDGGTTR
jgi:hypothetical protein